MAGSCSSLLINVNDLLSLQGVEKQKVEFKKAWHGKREGGTYWQIIHTICAFANDFYNDNGGYIIIGVEEKENWEDHADDRQIILPPAGVHPKDLERIQKEIMGACRANIKPEYFPILSPEVIEFQGVRRHVLVIWITASDDRPHTCKESEKGVNRYYIRRATETKKATSEEERTLLSLHRKIPFDDRRALDTGSGRQMSEDDIHFDLVKKFLNGVKSQLLEGNEDKLPIYFYGRLKLVRNIGDKRVGNALIPVFVPRNVALLFFHSAPHDFFTGAKTEIAIYTHDDDSEEKVMTGPIDQQIEDTLNFILHKTKEEARHEFVAYPTGALREAVVNAFHHRGYEECDNSPIKIHIKPGHIDVISYPGPDPSLKSDDFSEGGEVPPVPSRNRRIAEFLKDRKLAEGRFTGVRTIYRTMKKNKNPQPSFHFDSSYFRVRLPGHPKYIAYSILRDVNYLSTKGDKHDAIKSLKSFLDEHLDMAGHSLFGSEMLLSKLIALHDNDMEHPNIKPYQCFISEKLQRCIPLITELCKWCTEEKIEDISKGVKIVERLVEEGARYDDLHAVVTKAVDLCMQRDITAVQNAHKLFEAMGEITQNHGYVAYHFANCKLNLYKLSTRSEESETEEDAKKKGKSLVVSKRKSLVGYLKEAEEYVDKAIQLTNEDFKSHLANQYRLLGYIHSELLLIRKSTKERIKGFYEKARKYNPGIKINSLNIPPEYHSQFRLPGSPESPGTFNWKV